MKTSTAAAFLGALVMALPAIAADPPKVIPQPIKPVPPTLYSGRWYEIARTPNKIQADCQASTNDFSNWQSGVFSVTETCHHGSPVGPKQVMNASGHILPASDNAKMRLGFMGGLITQEYWILDRSDDSGWAIMDRSDGRYVWLLSRQPTLSASDKAVALARLQALGFDTGHLAYPQQP